MLHKLRFKPFLSLLTLLILSNCKVENIQVPPSVVTKPATDVSLTSATLNGEVISEGGQATNDRGFVFSKTETIPTFSNQKLPMAYGLGPFNTTLTNLDLGTTYYFRAYATNPAGTQFGSVEKFTTGDAKLPTVSQVKVTNITINSFDIEIGTIIDGGATIIESGVVIGTTASPTIESATLKLQKDINQVIQAKNLIDNTVYYLRAYAKNVKGISYGNEITVTTLSDFSKQLRNGLITYYPFNGNSNDISNNNLNAVNNGANLTTNRFNESSSAYLFNNSSIYIPYRNILTTTNLTTSTWINPSSYGPDNYSIVMNRFEQGYDNPGGETWQVILTNNEVWFQILGVGTSPNGNNTIVKLAKTIPLNQWTLINCSYDGKYMKIYINGTEQLSQPTQTKINTYGTSGVSIGISRQANGTFHNFTGKIDDVGLWNRALSSDEIKFLYTNGINY